MDISAVPTHLAWEFTHLLPGTFRRNKVEFAHHEYPILGPLPAQGPQTRPLESSPLEGPFLYFVVDDRGAVCYVGKSQEQTVLKRWIRTGTGGPARHYWTHSTKSGGAVFRIAEGLRQGRRFQLRYTALDELRRAGWVAAGVPLDAAERQAIATLHPRWNKI
ncbi:hypothetical protein [Ramlibacter sp. AN1133]|uniref:hypothetical protein n=1 Tax=Ramlibacter sp. AN1133 TaxID=3133429 RepID=UPI0030C47E0B